VAGEDPQTYVLKALEITKNKEVLQDAREHTLSSVKELDWRHIAQQVESIFRMTIDSHMVGAITR